MRAHLTKGIRMTSETGKRLHAIGWVGMAGIIVLLAALTGCGTVDAVKKQTRKVVKAMPFTGSRFKNKVAILPFQNRTYLLQRDVDELFYNRLTRNLESTCSDVIWVRPSDPAYPSQLKDVPRLVNGQVDNLELSRRGQELGFQAVLTGGVLTVEAAEKESGILLFKDSAYYECVRVNFQIFHTGTGAKLLDETLTCETEIDGASFDAIEKKDTRGTYELEDAMGQIVTGGSDRVCEAIMKEKWQGFVVSVEDGRVILSSGRESGLKVGDALTVYERGEIIEGASGERFILSGVKSAEIEVSEVLVGRATARIKGEGRVVAGFTVRAD